MNNESIKLHAFCISIENKCLFSLKFIDIVCQGCVQINHRTTKLETTYENN